MLDLISFLFHFVPSINIGTKLLRDGFLNGMEGRYKNIPTLRILSYGNKLIDNNLILDFCEVILTIFHRRC